MTGADLTAAAGENLVAHFTFAQRQLPGMRAVVAGDVVLTSSGLPCDTFNAICRARLAPGTAKRRIREAIAWFEGLPFSWWVGPGDAPQSLGALLESEGLTASETEQAMVLSLDGLEHPRAAPLRIRRVATPEELAEYARVEAANWTPPDADVLRFYERAAAVLLAAGSPLRFYVGYAGGEAVAAAELTVAGGVAGLYGIATLDSHRGRGYGSAMTLAPLLDARAEGISAAVLQASVAGAGIYERIGFRQFGEYTEYKP